MPGLGKLGEGKGFNMFQMDLSCLLQLDLSCFDIMLLFPSVRFIQIWISLSGAQLGGRRGEQVFRVN